MGPYVADGLVALFAFFWFPRKRCAPFIGSLLLSVTYLRSLFDVTVNYTADTLFGGKGDFDFLLSGYPRLAVHAVAVLIILISAGGAAREIVSACNLTKAHFVESSVSMAE
jgi:hypothetical protein